MRLGYDVESRAARALASPRRVDDYGTARAAPASRTRGREGRFPTYARRVGEQHPARREPRPCRSTFRASTRSRGSGASRIRRPSADYFDGDGHADSSRSRFHRGGSTWRTHGRGRERLDGTGAVAGAGRVRQVHPLQCRHGAVHDCGRRGGRRGARPARGSTPSVLSADGPVPHRRRVVSAAAGARQPGRDGGECAARAAGRSCRGSSM